MSTIKKDSELERLEAQLAGQFEAMGVDARIAVRAARDQVRSLEADGAGAAGKPPPCFVLPHAGGWTVARAFAVTGPEIFEEKSEALRRAAELAAADGSRVIVCDDEGGTCADEG